MFSEISRGGGGQGVNEVRGGIGTYTADLLATAVCQQYDSYTSLLIVIDYPKYYPTFQFSCIPTPTIEVLT